VNQNDSKAKPAQQCDRHQIPQNVLLVKENKFLGLLHETKFFPIISHIFINTGNLFSWCMVSVYFAFLFLLIQCK